MQWPRWFVGSHSFDLPGVDQDKISVEVENDALTVSAQRERMHEETRDRFYRYERKLGSFSRTVGLPQGVSEDDIKASYANGVLEVRYLSRSERNALATGCGSLRVRPRRAGL